jgi:pimeloyl-ACP methyl ester carboxylesterase
MNGQRRIKVFSSISAVQALGLLISSCCNLGLPNSDLSNSGRLKSGRSKSDGTDSRFLVAFWEVVLRILKIVAGVFGLILACLPALALAGLGFVGSSFLTRKVWMWGSVALLINFVVASLIAFWLFRILGSKEPLKLAIAYAVLTSTLLSILLSLTVYWPMPDGSRIAYRKARGAKPVRPYPVVFLHGGPGNIAVARKGLVLERLANDGFDVYHYDQLGGGLSSRLENLDGYTIKRFVNDLEQIRLAIHAEKLIVVGHSWGAALLANYLAVHPDRVAQAVFDSPGNFEATPNASHFDERMSSEAKLGMQRILGTPRMAVFGVLINTFNSPNGPYFIPEPELAAGFTQAIKGALPVTVCDPKNVEDTSGLSGFGVWPNLLLNGQIDSEPSPKTALEQVNVPSLILRGECDYVDWKVTRLYRDTIPNAKLVYVPRAGHGISHEQPEVYYQTIKAFLLDKSLPSLAYTGSDDPAKR